MTNQEQETSRQKTDRDKADRRKTARELTAVTGYENPATLKTEMQQIWNQGNQIAYDTPPDPERTQAENRYRAILNGIRVATCLELRRGLDASEPERLQTLRDHMEGEQTRVSRWAKERITETERHILKNTARKDFITEFGFPVLTRRAVQIMEIVARGKKILEVGAGNGYLAYEMHSAGADIVATEPHEPGKDNRYFTDPVEWAKEPVERLDAESAVLKYPREVLIWSWPEPDAEHTDRALRKFQGDTVIYIGENSWGSTGSEEFHRILKRQFVRTVSVRLPRFPGARDWVRVYQR